METRLAGCRAAGNLSRKMNFNSHTVVRIVGACLFVSLLSQTIALAAEPVPRRNVLFLIADDLNTRLACYGAPRATTPNIDRLAARGVRFARAYCNFPLCGPSRNSMLTGLYPNSSGILANSQIFRQTIPQHISLPQAFRLDGYFAARLGKLYHFNVPSSIGTDGHDDPASWELEMNPAGVDRMEEPPRIFSLKPGQFGATLSWYASPKSDEFHTDGILARDAEWVLERCARQKERPFFLAVGFFRPHTPYVSPKKPYFNYHPESDMPVISGVKEDQTDLPGPALGSAQKEQDEMSDDLRRQAVQAYYASVSFMDAQVGRVVAALDRLGLADNTIIVFTSDHGYHLGEHGLWQKRSLFDESARVPLLIVSPGAASNSVAKTPVALVDLYPTLTELCGVPVPPNLQGQTLVPLLKNPDLPGRGWAVTQVTRGTGEKQFSGYSLRTARWRYTEWDGGKRGREFYDHDKDPRELSNLASLPAHTNVLADLSRQLQSAVAATFPASGIRPELNEGLWSPQLEK